MQTIIQDLFKQITNEIGKLKTDKDEDQVIINNLLKEINCLSYDVYKNIDMDFLSKVEVNRQ